MAARAGSSSASSSSSARWASKMAASAGAGPARDDLAVALDRAARRAMPCSSRPRSRSPVARLASAGAAPRPPSRCAGPMATPAEAATPVSTVPRRRAARSPRSAATSGGAPARRRGRRRARRPRTPRRPARAARRRRLRLGPGRGHHQRVPKPRAERHEIGQAAGAHRRAPPALATRTSASKRRAVSTKRAAGRACSPMALRTSSSAVASAAAAAGRSASGAGGRRRRRR